MKKHAFILIIIVMLQFYSVFKALTLDFGLGFNAVYLELTFKNYIRLLKLINQ